MKQLKVIKRNGTLENYDISKIKSAVKKAYDSLGEALPSSVNTALEYLSNDFSNNNINIEAIQDKVEDLLMQDNRKVAKAFILYREKHKQLREAARKKDNFIQSFITKQNAADTTIDDNANVGNKNISVLNAEIHKEDNKNTNFYLWEKYVKKLYPDLNIKQMRKDFDTILYAHDSSSQVMMPYCMAVSMYPFLLNGLKDLGGKSAVPKNLDSFCGIYVNLIFALASEVKGAVATPEVLMYMDYFCRKEWGDSYYEKEDIVITNEFCNRVKTIGSQIDQYFQQITYSINQPSGSRSSQSPFTNFSFFDKYFFEGMFKDFRFPDGSPAKWESTNWLQKRYLHWLNQERLKCMLTFPVCSYACLIEDDDFKDKETFDFISQEYSEGNSFFTYLSESVDSLSSCCRLQNAIQENTFSFTNGQIGVMTGSKNVITLNLNRIIQDSVDKLIYENNKNDSIMKQLNGDLIDILDRVYKYHTAYNKMLHDALDNNLLLSYKAGFINLDKQYLTIGINGLNQAAEFIGIDCTNNEDYKKFCRNIFSIIKEQNTLHKTKTEMYNCEQVPAESAAIKLYNRDKKDGYWIPEDTNLYASYIFKPNDSRVSILDKITMHSKEFASDSLDGGQSAHLNLAEHLSKTQYKVILKYAAKKGCKYFTFNVPNSECENCGYITKVPIKECPKCKSKKITLWDRVIGYLTPVKNWSEGRRKEFKQRVFETL